MEREQFIKSLGLSVAVACTASCFTSCSKSPAAKPETSNPSAPGSGTLASLDLSTDIPNVGDQIVKGSVLVFRIATGSLPAAFVATESTCPHQGGHLKWLQGNSLVQCQLHQSEYKEDGSVIQGPQGIAGTTRPLKIYSVAVTGTNLSVS